MEEKKDKPEVIYIKDPGKIKVESAFMYSHSDIKCVMRAHPGITFEEAERIYIKEMEEYGWAWKKMKK